MAPNIIFYDIPSQPSQALPDGGAWSPNTLKTRFTLHYKGIPFKVVWVEYPDIATVCKQIGAASTSFYPDGRPRYSLPVIHDLSTDTVVSDSYNIAEYLDNTYPDTPVLLPKGSKGLQTCFQKAFTDLVISKVYPILLCNVPNFLNEPSEQYFTRARVATFGKILEAIIPPGEARDEQFRQARAGWDTVAGWYKGNKDESLFMMGDTPSYADVTVVAYFTAIHRLLGADSEDRKSIASFDDGRWVKLMKAFGNTDTSKSLQPIAKEMPGDKQVENGDVKS